MAAKKTYSNRNAGDPFTRLFGVMWSFSILVHIVFFAIFAVAASGAPKSVGLPSNEPLVFDLADLPKGPGIGITAPTHSQSEALNPFQGMRTSTKEKLSENDMPENVKPNVRVNSKQRSRENRPAVKVEDKLRNNAIERLKEKAQAPGGGGEGTADGGSISKLYLAKVREKIRSRWKLPSGLSGQELERSAKVTIRIDKAGNLIGSNVTDSSGNKTLDTSIQSAITQATPFTQPPLEMADQVSGGGISFTFKAKEAK
jgi:TonB family protein